MGKGKIYTLLLTLVIIVLLSSFVSVPTEKQFISYKRTGIYPEFLVDSSQWADSVLESLTIEEKVAQLFMLPVWPEKGEAHINKVNSIIKKYNPGGIIFFQGGPVTQVQITNTFQAIAKTPLLIAIDGEWGLAMRLDSVPSFPRQMMLGAIQDNELIYQYGARIGEQMNRVGVHVNFAPVIDVNNNANNPVINSRSFGEDRDNVSRKGTMYMMGMQDKRVLATAKHFPGHGDTDVDSHESLPFINHNYNRLDSLELYPFKNLIDNGVGGVMVAHLYVPSIDSTENQATSLSPKVVDSLLKAELGFKGLVFTDAMNMGGVANHYSPGEADYKAFLAGNDVMLMPRDFSKAIETISNAVKNGEIDEAEINQRCKKILLAKSWAGLESFEAISTKNLIADLNTQKDDLLIKKLSDESVTVVQNKNSVLPLVNVDDMKVASVSVGVTGPNNYTKHLNLYQEDKRFYISKNASWKDYESMLTKLAEYDLVILSLHSTSLYPTKKYGITTNSVHFIDSLLSSKKVVFNYFGNPYGLNSFNELAQSQAIVLAYQDTKENQNTSAEIIYGALPAKGILPVSIQNYPSGTGIQLDHTLRLSYGFPEEVGMSSWVLSAIDTIVEDAIREMATPGCQVLVARKGKVIYQKSYGYHTYQKKEAVEDSHLYDLASITKIGATLPLVMQMYGNGQLDINKPLSTYLSNLDTTNKSTLLVSDILYHEAQLKAWIPFYISTLESMFPNEAFSSNSISEQYPYQIGNRYYLNKHIKYKDNYFSHTNNEEFPVEIADGLYGRGEIYDTVFKRIYASDLRENKGYKYSDLGFYMLYRTIEEQLDTSFEELAYQSIYKKIGANRLGYLPLKQFSKAEIVPTENDIIFRRQLVHGYVHDPGAAMIGGVSGHAGLFSNANDLAKLMQMYLNGGTYGGVRLIQDTILNEFTVCHSCNKNRRGLGFDKPELNKRLPSPVCESASPSSFGHTGFTGTITWVDPEYDLVYIFLSNRVHPDALNSKLVSMNVRTNIQQTVYNAIME